MSSYKNEDHNEAVMVEEALMDASGVLTDLSNALYRRNPNHPLLADLSSVISAVENDVPWDKHYEALERSADVEDWWAER